MGNRLAPWSIWDWRDQSDLMRTNELNWSVKSKRGKGIISWKTNGASTAESNEEKSLNAAGKAGKVGEKGSEKGREVKPLSEKACKTAFFLNPVCATTGMATGFVLLWATECLRMQKARRRRRKASLRWDRLTDAVPSRGETGYQ